MFEAITFCPQSGDANKPLDIGTLVECMLLYGRTVIIANPSILRQLMKFFGYERLLILIEEELLTLLYPETKVGIISTTTESVVYHDVIEFSSPQHTFQDELRRICIEISGRSGRGRRMAQHLQDKVNVTKHDQVIIDGARTMILDQDYVKTSAAIILSAFLPEIGQISSLRFSTEKTQYGIAVRTNLNFAELNSIYHKRVPAQHSSITPAYMMVQMLDVEMNLYFAASNMSELATSPLSAKLAAEKVSYIIARSNRAKETLSHFREFIFEDGKTIRDAVNAGAVNLDDLIKVLMHSQRFKQWIVNIPPEANLLQVYYKEVIKGTFLDKLPGKTARWAIFTGAGLATDALGAAGVGTAIGFALGVLDSFVLDKLISGWKPNQYIEEEVKSLVGENT